MGTKVRRNEKPDREVMDIALPFRHSKNDDEELRYSLRSLKNISFDRLFIVGDKPSWIQNVTHIPMGDIPYFRECSICAKMLAACDHTDEWIRWDDDYILLKPIKEIKPWHSGKVKEWLEHPKCGSHYRDIIAATYEEVQDFPYFDIHVPMVFNSKKFREVMSDIPDSKVDRLIKTTYCYRTGIVGEPQFEKDMKINDQHMAKHPIIKLLEGRTFFTLGDHGLSESMKDVLNRYFPNKSKFEK